MNTTASLRLVLLCIAAAILSLSFIACENTFSAEVTPERVVGNFLRETGLGNFEVAKEYVDPGSHSEIESWAFRFYFPDHSTPVTSEEESNLAKFIGNFYRITLMDHTDIEANVHLVFVATDALVGFPSVMDNPLIPNSASWMIILRREHSGEGEDVEYGDWKMVSMD